MIIPKETDADNKIIKFKRMIRKCALNIIVWLENNPNPTTDENTDEKLNELRQLKGGYSDAIINYCTKLTEEKANEIRVLKGKVNDNVFYYCDNITSGGWEKHTTTLELPQPVLEHQAYLDKGIDAQEEE